MTERPVSDPQPPPGQGRGPAPRHRTPVWVKAFLVAAVLLVVTFAVIHLSGGGMMNHTP